MIIQCDHCSAKFRMDDSKLAKGPVKVRCAKCKEVFSVSKDEPSPEISAAITQNDSMDRSASAASDWPASETASAAESGVTGNADYAAAANEFSLNFDEPVSAAVPAPGYDQSAPGEDSSARTGDLDLSFASGGGDFDFSDSPAADSSPASAEDDFSMDFGEVSFSEPLSADKPVSVEPPKAADFDLPASADDDGGFNFSFDTDVAAEKPTAETSAPAAGAVNYGDFDFGEIDQPAVGQAAPVIAKQLRDFPAAGVTAAGLVVPSNEEDAPPSSLSSRKKRSSFFPLTVILGAILLVILLAGSAVYFVSGPKAFSKVGLGFLVDWYGAKGVEEGSVSVRNVTAEYMTNKEAGELFVVRGEALNNYNKPRASIQVKVTILGSGGTPLLTKTAFCGNSLTKEQLATLPAAKIEETMNNQFGDSLANMGVKPGNAIPFVIVLGGVPKEASDYSVQVSGSTIATQ